MGLMQNTHSSHCAFMQVSNQPIKSQPHNNIVHILVKSFIQCLHKTSGVKIAIPVTECGMVLVPHGVISWDFPHTTIYTRSNGVEKTWWFTAEEQVSTV